jgi:cytidylate kinase
MRIFLPPLEIGDTEGFTKEKDLFGRSTIGDGLTNFVTSVTDPTVIAVDGQWGSGKTTFLKMWAGELRKAGFAVVYFDAFQNDYAEDAFTAIAGEIISLAQEQRKAGTAAAKKFVNKAVGAGKVILRSGLKLGVKLATMGALEAADLENVAEDVAKEASEVEDKYLGELLTKQREQREVIQSFREALGELPALLTKAAKEGDEAEQSRKSLIIIIDELDRCRPSFALQILERIKHFFAVPHVHFILGAHLSQLENSVKVAYGSNIDAHMYLQKFIHLTLHLVDSALQPHQRTNAKFIEYLSRAMQFQEKNQTVQYARDYFRYVAEKRNMSLRAIERVMSTLAIALAYKPENLYSPMPIILGLCVLKVMDPNLYLKAKAGTLALDEVRGPLGFTDTPDEGDEHIVEFFSSFWEFCLKPNLPEDGPHQQYHQGLWRYHLDRQKVVLLVANSIMDRLTPA